MGSEKFCLRWNDFESNISSAFRELRDDKDFFDITLACDDEQIQAHKVILSACSPFFRNILRRNPHQHPLLYLKGVKYTDLQSVLNFMYHGEVNVAQEELNSFLAVAEDLRVKGLTQNQSHQAENTTKERQHAVQKPQATKTPSRPPDREKRPCPPPYTTTHNDDVQEVVPVVKAEPSDPLPTSIIHQQPSTAALNLYSSQQLVQQGDQGMQINYQEEEYEDYGQYEAEQEYAGHVATEAPNTGQSFQDPSELLQFVSKATSDQGKSNFVCTICKTFSHLYRTNVRNHVESKHFPNMFSYECEHCGQTFPSKNSLQIHRHRVHKPKSQNDAF